MKNFKKVVALLLVCAMTVSMAACSKTPANDNPSKAEANGENVSGTNDEHDPVTLKIITWSNAGSVEAINALSSKFMDKYPWITVELTDVDTNQYPNLQSTRIQANDVDIISLNGSSFLREKVDWAPSEAPIWQQLIDNGVLVDLTDMPWISNWSSGADYCTYKDRVWAVTTGANATSGIFYNKAMFAEHGWKVPETWAEFETLCADIKAAGIAPMTVGGADVWPYLMIAHPIMASLGIDYEEYTKQLWSGEASANDAVSMKALERMDFFNQNLEPGFMGISYAEVIGRFVNGKAAMLPDGSWQSVEIVKADENFEFGYFPLPGDEPGTKLEGKFDLMFAVNANSSHTEEALLWMEMLSDKANYTEFVNTTGFIPTMEGIEIKNAFVSELLPYTENMQKNWECIWRVPQGVGQYAESSDLYCGQYLKSAGGEVETVKELADLTEKDLRDAINALK